MLVPRGFVGHRGRLGFFVHGDELRKVGQGGR